ncbi:hypothetical protein IFR05_016343 [Cadophora sp. M221]|nr:hypothetical protein IFR05_016343 [Cadophora sp. M221]
MGPRTHNPGVHDVEQPAIPNRAPQEHNRPISRETRHDQPDGIMSIDDRFTIIINEHVKKEVEQKLASTVREQLEGLLKPIVDLLQSGISSHPKEGDLGQKIAAIVKQQLEALPKKPIAASNVKSASKSVGLLSNSQPINSRSTKRTSLAAPRRPDSDFLTSSSPNFIASDCNEALTPRQLMHTNTPSRSSDPKHRTRAQKHALEGDPPELGARKKQTGSFNEAQWIRSWTDIYFGKQINTTVRKNYALSESTLPVHLQTLILAQDLSFSTHRVTSKEMNQKGTPTECWMSQFHPRVDWPKSDGIPKSTYTIAIDAQRKWWKKEWNVISRVHSGSGGRRSGMLFRENALSVSSGGARVRRTYSVSSLSRMIQ